MTSYSNFSREQENKEARDIMPRASSWFTIILTPICPLSDHTRSSATYKLIKSKLTRRNPHDFKIKDEKKGICTRLNVHAFSVVSPVNGGNSRATSTFSKIY